MRKGQMYRIANATKEKGIFLTISTNGTLIREWDAQRIPSSGINNIVFSIDSHVERIHDMIRGRDGTYKKVLNSLRMVKKYLHDSGENCHILTSTILGSHNIGEIDALIDLLNSLEVDNSLFQPIQPVFMRDKPNNWWETTPLFPHEKETIDSALSTLIRAKNQGFRTFHETYQLEDMRLYLKKETLPQDQCNSFHRNIMVDIVGNVRLCFNMERIGLQPVSHIGNAPLCDIWDQCNDVRERMNGCTECCGVMICHAR